MNTYISSTSGLSEKDIQIISHDIKMLRTSHQYLDAVSVYFVRSGQSQKAIVSVSYQEQGEEKRIMKSTRCEDQQLGYFETIIKVSDKLDRLQLKTINRYAAVA